MDPTKRERAEALGWQVEYINDSVGGEDHLIEYYVLVPPDATPQQRKDPEEQGFDSFETEDEAWDAVPIED